MLQQLLQITNTCHIRSTRSGQARILNKASFANLSAGQQDIIRRIVEANEKSNDKIFAAVLKAIWKSEALGVSQTEKSERELHRHIDSLKVDNTDQLAQ